jgi:hypothetical protein
VKPWWDVMSHRCPRMKKSPGEAGKLIADPK